MDAFLEDGSHETAIAVVRALVVAVPNSTDRFRDYILKINISCTLSVFDVALLTLIIGAKQFFTQNYVKCFLTKYTSVVQDLRTFSCTNSFK